MKEILNPGENSPVGPYSPIVKAGDFLFLSGQVAENPDTGKLLGGDVGEQTYQIMSQIRNLLTANGYSMEDIVKCNIYMKDRKDFDKMNSVYKQFFKLYPARITVYVSDLYEGCDIEIDATAYCGKKAD